MAMEISVAKKRGRPPGALNKKTRAVLEQARKEGLTPLEVRLKNMRRWYRLALALERRAALSERSPEAMLERANDFRQRAQEFAVAASPFVHRRLGRVKCIVDPEPTVVVLRPGQSFAEWQEKYAGRLFAGGHKVD